MIVVLGLLLFLLVLNVAALTGWAPSTRDGRDWQPAGAAGACTRPVQVSSRRSSGHQASR